MIILVPFRDEHADRLKLREIDRRSIAPQEPSEMIRQIAHLGPFMTMLVDDEIMAIGGVMILWPGVGEAWVGTSSLVERYPIIFTKCVRGYLNAVIRDEKLHRVQLNIVEYHKRSLAWVRLLGFFLESKMEKYGPNQETYYRFVRFA